MSHEEEEEEENRKKIKISIDRAPEIDSLHDELSILKSEKEQSALFTFEIKKELEALKNPSLSEKILSSNTPSQLEELLDRHKHTPTGTASMEAPDFGNISNKEAQIKIIDDIYKILRNPKNHTKDEINEAQKKRATLLKSMITGASSKALLGEQLVPKGHAKIERMDCPQCGATIDTSHYGNVVTCPTCGKEFSNDRS